MYLAGCEIYVMLEYIFPMFSLIRFKSFIHSFDMSFIFICILFFENWKQKRNGHLKKKNSHRMIRLCNANFRVNWCVQVLVCGRRSALDRFIISNYGTFACYWIKLFTCTILIDTCKLFASSRVCRPPIVQNVKCSLPSVRSEFVFPLVYISLTIRIVFIQALHKTFRCME